MWITDNDAKSHMRLSKDEIKNPKENKTGVVIGNGCILSGKHRGNLDFNPVSKQVIFSQDNFDTCTLSKS